MRLSRRGLLTAVIVVLALWVGSLVTRLLPSPGDVYSAPFSRQGVVGEPVDTRAYEVTVTGVRAGSQVAQGVQVAVTEGVWLVVDLHWSPHGETTTLDAGEIQLVAADGRHFGGLPGLVVSCGTTQPGLTMACSVPFELPADALAGAQVVIPSSRVGAMDDQAEIDLQLTSDAAAELTRAPGLLELGEPTPVGG